MNISRAWYWVDALGKNVLSVRGITAFLSSFGALWLLVEIGNNWSPQFAADMRASGWQFLAIGILLAGWLCRPITKFERRLDGRDVCIEVRVGDLFKTEGTLIVGTNTTFDTRIAHELIHESSIQGQFTRRYFANEGALDLQIDNALKGVPFTEIAGEREGKRHEYKIGTTVKVQAKGVRSFWVAMARMNARGAAQTNRDELSNALAELWVYIADQGTCDTLVCAAMGSKYGQTALTREESVRLMIQSFVAACAERTFCERFVIVLSGRDVTQQKIDLPSLNAYLEHVCRYAPYKRSSEPPVGVGI